MRGDRVEIVVDGGAGTLTYFVEATRAGRRVEIVQSPSIGARSRAGVQGVVEVVEVTRGGTPVRTARFMASRVLALVEHPASQAPATSP